ncbi:hypothetical protein [Arthrobacter agilis]|uniref:hypothetical protein n=1 Tax=Arthrobacter agilis TaxID=37921 RepID=UPI00278AB21D|nr:hypothetical protein [Arthrobacter agilis]MDQ0735092.1 Mg-chelatase subunit ChlD [Arthrobacter agilis]
MHLEVTRSGGFTSLTRQWSTDIPDSDCTPLLTALEQADESCRKYPDERMYEIHLGDTSATVPERHTLHGALATLIERAQHGNHDH